MKLISWNVNGLRAAVRKGCLEDFARLDPDVICLQEIKLQEGQIELELPGYEFYWNYAVRKGYSGVAVFTKKTPLCVTYGLGIEEHDQEGRVITCEFEDFFLVTCYTPNSKRNLLRLDYRMEWEDAFREHLCHLDEKKPVVLCGDLNVAHREIDLENPASNRRNAGFSDEERGKFTELLDAGFTDSYRYFYPDREKAYTWWSNFNKSRERNIGWRIDYFLVSNRFMDSVEAAEIHPQIFGSDHCPVELVLNAK